MPVIHHNCPLCLSPDTAELLQCKDHLLTDEEFEIRKCNSCHFIFTQGAPSAGQIGKYYQSQDYISHSDTRKGLMNSIYHRARKIMLGKKFRMVNKVARGKKLLDIGCGTGYFPAYMNDKGYQATGVEVDEKARKFAKKEWGIPVFSPEEFLDGKTGQKFDIITLWHVLEHLDDFDLYMKKMLEHIEKDGTLVIALPNCNALDARFYKEYWAGYDVPRHLWHFTPSTFQKLADQHHLKITTMKRLPLDPFYNAMLSEKYKGNKLYMFAGLIIGEFAYLESLFNVKKSSSIVYILKRKSDL